LSFPSNPADGATTTINGVTYVYSSANTSWSPYASNSTVAYTSIAVSGNSNVTGTETVGTSVVTGSETVGGDETVSGNQLVLGNLGVGTITPSAKVQIVSPGGWSAYNYGKGLYVTTTSGASNPAIGISDYTGLNNWAIVNASGKLFFSTMPAISDSSTGSTTRIAINASGNVGIGTESPSVKLAISGTDAVLLPVGTTSQRPSPASGYIRFNSEIPGFEGYNGTTWGSLGGATGGGLDQIFYLNGQTVTTNYTIPTNFNAGSVGPVAINAGVTVTIPSGSVWSIN
jgi:hypothetical protein